MQKKEEKLQEQLSDMAGERDYTVPFHSDWVMCPPLITALDHLPPHFTHEQSSDNLSKHSRLADRKLCIAQYY